MSNLIQEDSPRNTVELFGLLKDFMLDGLAYPNDDECYKVCETLQKVLLDKKFITLGHRDTILAEKLEHSV